jgi:hypothetical protein
MGKISKYAVRHILDNIAEIENKYLVDGKEVSDLYRQFALINLRAIKNYFLDAALTEVDVAAPAEQGAVNEP